jgi:serine/threonine protein kinase
MAGLSVGPRFDMRQRLGAGSFGVVYEAFDRERQIPVALKVLRSEASESLYLFKREFRALADLNHRNLVTLYELLTDGPYWFFTMELLRGRHFIDHAWDVPAHSRTVTARVVDDTTLATTVIAPGLDLPWSTSLEHLPKASAASDRRLDYDRVRAALRQLGEGLVALHASGRLHRDIKPRNVIVAFDGRVVLLDFGLVTSVAGSSLDPTMGRIAGTPAYMSPEQASGETLSPSSDWYSVGVMLYETLTRHFPFSGSTRGVSTETAGSALLPVEAWDPHVPSDLSRLCLDLLARDPKRRPGGQEVLARLEGARTKTAPTSTATVGPASPFVGRQQELASLSVAYEAMAKGRAVVSYVRGTSGIGKTTLVQHFLQRLSSHAPETIVLRGRCYQQESVPYKGLDLIVDELSQWFRTQPDVTIDALLPRDVLALVRLFPVLKRVDAIAYARRRTFDPPDAQEARRRAIAAFRELLARLTERWPVVLFIDDLQWSDLDSTHLLVEVLRPPDPPKLMFIGAYRSDEADTSPALRQLLALTHAMDIGAGSHEVTLREFGPPEVGALVAALAGGDEQAVMPLSDQVHRESGGNPFFVQELTRLAVKKGSVDTSGDVSLESAILQRISAMAGPTTRLLHVLALAGRPLVPRIAFRVAEILPRDYGVLASLRVAQLIRSRQTDRAEEIEVYHDRIREVVSHSLSAADAVRVHERLALALEASGDADPEMLALHFSQAGHPDRAAGHAVVAADRAAALLAFDRAGRLYHLALALQPDTANAAELRLKLADALANAGRGGDAGRAYLAAAADVTNDRPRLVDLQRRAAEQFLISGHMDQGMVALSGVLEAVGMRLARTPFSAMLLLLVRRIVLWLRGLSFRERPASQLTPDLLLRIDSCWSVAIGLAFIDSIRAAEFQARHCLLALASGEPNRIARALALEAGYTSLGGTITRRRTATIVRSAQSLAERLNQPHALGLASLTAGIAAHLEGRWRASLDLCERADTMLSDSCTGVTWELDTARLHIVNNVFLLGDLTSLCDRVPAFIASAVNRGDVYGATALILRTAFMTALIRHDPQGALDDITKAESPWSGRREFLLQHYWAVVARLDVLAYQGKGLAAHELIDGHWRKFAAAQMRRVQFTRVESSYRRARSALMVALDLPPGSSRHKQLLSEVKQHCRVLTSEPVDWSVGLGHFVYAGAERSFGHEDRAVTSLTLAEERFERAGMALHAALSRRARGRLIGGDHGREFLDASDAWLRTHRVVDGESVSRMIAGWV